MEFRYLMPVCDRGVPDILTIDAKNIKQATDLLIKKFVDEYEELPYPADLDDLRENLEEYDVLLGDFKEVNEFLN